MAELQTTADQAIQLAQKVPLDTWVHFTHSGCNNGTSEHLLRPREERYPHLEITIDAWSGLITAATLNLNGSDRFYDGKGSENLAQNMQGNGKLIAFAERLRRHNVARQVAPPPSLSEATIIAAI